MSDFTCWSCRTRQPLPDERRRIKGQVIRCSHCDAEVEVRTLAIKRFITLLVYADLVALGLLTLNKLFEKGSVIGAEVFALIGFVISFVGAVLVFGVTYLAAKATHRDLPSPSELDDWWGPFPKWPSG